MSFLIAIAIVLFGLATLTGLTIAYFYVPCWLDSYVGMSSIPLAFGLLLIGVCLIIDIIICALVWLKRGRDTEATQRFLHQRDNESWAARLGE